MAKKLSMSLLICSIVSLILFCYIGFSSMATDNTQVGELENGFTWEYIPSSHSLIISGNGEMPELDVAKYYAGEYWDIGDDLMPLEKLIIDDGVIAINSLLQDIRLSCKILVIGKDLSSDNGLGGLATDGFIIDERNDYFSIYDGALYSQNGVKLVSCPDHKTTIAFNEKLKIIGDHAFYNSHISGTLVLPWGIESLEENVFYYMGTKSTGGVTIVLPDTISAVSSSFGNRYGTVSYLFSQNMVAKDSVMRELREIGYRLNEDKAWMVDSVLEYYSDIFSATGLIYQNGKAYYYENGVLQKSKWVYADGNWYYLNDYGAGVVNCWRLNGGKYYYLGADGKMKTNSWVKDYGNWYYVKADGSRYESSWVKIGGVWYWFGGSGKMAENQWLKLADGKWYYFTTSGAMAANRWVKSGSYWYYVGKDGAMLTDTTTPDGYKVDAAGRWR